MDAPKTRPHQSADKIAQAVTNKQDPTHQINAEDEPIRPDDATPQNTDNPQQKPRRP